MKGSEGPPPPLIGLSTYTEVARFGAWEENAALLPHSYVAAVGRAGGSPLLLPPSPLGPGPVLQVLDGLVVTGGPDVGPHLYGAAPHEQTDPPREERDAWEMALCESALGLGLPLLAICRGMQVLNVALGGTLHQHLPEVVGHDSHRATLGQMTTNQVRLEPGALVFSVLGPTAEGHCHHHQALDRLGSGLSAVGFAADGTVEAVEVAGCDFAVGVQWHPEDNPADDRLFVALVKAAEHYKASHHEEPGAQVEPARR